jgi:hypothetical protein
MSDLPNPPDQPGDVDGIEILRVWGHNDDLQCSVYPGAFDEPGTWGVLLADLVRTITGALKEKDGKDPKETQDEIVAAFQRELADGQEA